MTKIKPFRNSANRIKAHSFLHPSAHPEQLALLFSEIPPDLSL